VLRPYSFSTAGQLLKVSWIEPRARKTFWAAVLRSSSQPRARYLPPTNLASPRVLVAVQIGPCGGPPPGAASRPAGHPANSAAAWIFLPRPPRPGAGSGARGLPIQRLERPPRGPARGPFRRAGPAHNRGPGAAGESGGGRRAREGGPTWGWGTGFRGPTRFFIFLFSLPGSSTVSGALFNRGKGAFGPSWAPPPLSLLF